MATDQHDHCHGGHHDHHNHDSTSFTEKNRSHWEYVIFPFLSFLELSSESLKLTLSSQFAANYSQEQWQRDMINDITAFILANISWIGVNFIEPSSRFEASDSPSRQVRVLDYACGPGTMTAALQSHATEFVGIDLSENMVKAYNARFSATEEGSESINAHAVVGDLLEAENPSPSSLSEAKFFGFDLVVIGLGFHHFEDLEEATNRFAARLQPGGVLMIVDFLPHVHAAKTHPAAHTVAHHGFGEEKVRELFRGAGLTDIGVVKMNREVLMRGLSPREPFLGRGRKP